MKFQSVGFIVKISTQSSKAKPQIRLRACASWSSPLLFASKKTNNIFWTNCFLIHLERGISAIPLLIS